MDVGVVMDESLSQLSQVVPLGLYPARQTITNKINLTTEVSNNVPCVCRGRGGAFKTLTLRGEVISTEINKRGTHEVNSAL